MELALVLKLEDHSAFVGVLQTALFSRGKSELIAGILLLGLEDDSARQHDGVLRIEQVRQRDAAKLVIVLVIQEHVAPSQFAVATGPTNLLDVVLKTSGHVEMNDRLDVRFVDAHREGNRAHKTPDLVVDEVPLNS